MNQEKKKTLLMNQLETARASLEAAFMLLEEDSDPEGHCLHPQSSREPCPVLDHPNQFFCRICSEVIGGGD